jgi:hypothetical protein
MQHKAQRLILSADRLMPGPQDSPDIEIALAFPWFIQQDWQQAPHPAR